MTDTTKDPLEGIRKCVKAQERLNEQYREAVTFARKQGTTWEAIGEAMGMTKQAAHSYGRTQGISDPR